MIFYRSILGLKKPGVCDNTGPRRTRYNVSGGTMPERLLIVDDEPRLTRSFKAIFERRGIEVETSDNGFDALRIFKRNPFKVVLSDVYMDEMDGIALLKKLQEIDPFVQVIFLTGYASIDNASRAFKQKNAFDYLQKPVRDMDELHAIIKRAEEKYDLEKYQITRKKEAQKAFSIFRGIFDSMEAIVYVSDIKTHELIYTNLKFRQVFGHEKSMPVEGLKCWEAVNRKQTGPCPFCTNSRLIRPDGTPAGPYEWEFHNISNNRWYHIVDKAVQWYDKRIVHLGTAYDITEKKEKENLFHEFEKAIETSRKLESIGTMAGGVAHDFNNTLSIIMGNINLAQLSCNEDEPLKYLSIAEKAIMQAKAISSNLISFARGGKPVKVRTDIVSLVRKKLETEIEGRDIQLIFEADAIPGDFYADPAHLSLAFGNIIKNSVEAMNGSGILKTKIKYQNPGAGTAKILISISDSGCGIYREHLDMIFNPYFTTKSMDNRKSKGFGLSIAWSVITRHGGTIKVDSTLNRGTDVSIILPVFNKNIQTDEISENDTCNTGTTAPAKTRTNARVLVMDDDELILDVIVQLLERLGYDTLSTSDGEQAIELCRAETQAGNKIDIALLDLDIHSGLGGFPSMRQLKKTDNNIKGILITGHSQESQAENYKDYGFSIMLEKPFSITRLDQAIRKLL